MPTTTSTTLPDRTFGVEIEACGISRAAATEAIRAIGLTVHMENYNHRTRPHWKVTTDASVEPGFEVVSPVLRGEAGIEEMRRVVSALSSAGARVDHRCGIHVHVGIADLSPAEAAAIVVRYAQFETEIDAFMPRSRRGNNNTYCQSVGEFARRLRWMNQLDSMRQVTRAQNSVRYVKVNLMAYDRQKTIEFRQHSGSCNASKIENWIRFCLHFVAATKESVTAAQAAAGGDVELGLVTNPPTRTLRRNSMDLKLDRVINALREAGRQGLSVSEIASLGDWSASSVPVYVSRIRSERSATIRKYRSNGRYRLVTGGLLTTSGMTPATTTTRRAARSVRLLPNDSLFRSIPGEIAGFYAERTAELNGTA